MAVRSTYVTSLVQRTKESMKDHRSDIKQASPAYWAKIYQSVLTGRKTTNYQHVMRLKSALADLPAGFVILRSRSQRLDNMAQAIYGDPYWWWLVYVSNLDLFETPCSPLEEGTQLKTYPLELVIPILRQLQEEY